MSFFQSKTASISYREESSDDDGEQPGSRRHRVRASSSFARRESSPESHQSFKELSKDDSPDEHDFTKASEPRRVKVKCPKRSPTKDDSFTIENHCYVCGKGTRKIGRHLQKHAGEEPEVAHAFSFPPHSAERKMLLGKLRNRGNYDHNQEVLRSNTGALKVKRRPKTGEASSSSFIHCRYCKILIGRAEMWKHLPNCLKRTLDTVASANTSDTDESEQNVPPDVKKILSGMEKDEATLVIRNDPLLIQLAKSLYRKYGNDPSKERHIREKLKELATLLLELHKRTILTFEDAIHSKNFSRVVRSVQSIVGFDPVKQTYSKRALAFNLGNSLKRIGNILLRAKTTDETTRNSAKAFIESCEKEWGGLVSDTIRARGGGERVSGPSTIPFTRDVQAFHAYLERLSASAAESLKTCEDPRVYSALARVTLAQVSVLSKRTSEVSEMTLKSFEERGDSTKVLSKHFIRINVLSKSGLNVAVLFTSQLVGALNLLISKRLACGVHRDNPFLFAKPDSSATSHFH